MFDNPIEFVKTLWPLAEKVAHVLGVDPKILLAQAALETGWGQHICQSKEGEPSYNLFNIKADSSWKKAFLENQTVEYEEGQPVQHIEPFRQYKNFEESFQDYVNFIASNPRYEKALEKAHEPESYILALQEAGYATDPDYAEKILEIYHGEQLANALPI